MAKIVLADVTNILGSPSTAQSTINSNSDLIETAFENTLSRDGTTPNHMLADFDMNDNDIVNVNNIDAKTFSIDGSQDFTSLIEQATVEADRSEAAADRAEIAANEAETHAGFVKNNWVIDGPWIGTGVEADYPLSLDPGSAANMFVIVGGVGQMLTTDAYSLVYSAGSPFIRITVPAGISFEARVGNSMVVGTPSDGTITTNKLANDAVTFDKTQNINTSRILGRVSASSGNIEELTTADVVGLITPVQYVTQSLTEAQQSVARINISAPLSGYLNGLTFVNDATDAANDFVIQAGSAASDSATPVLMRHTANWVKRTDAAWAAGSTNGCWLDGASMPDGTGHVYLMYNPTTGLTDIGASSSLTPTLPSGFTHKRRIFSIIKSSAVIIPMLQIGNTFLFRTSRTIRSSAAGLGDTHLQISAPGGIVTGAILYISQQQNAAGNCQAFLSTPGIAPVATVTTIAASEVATATLGHSVFTNTLSEVRYSVVVNSGSLTNNTLSQLGWVDTRGTV